MTERGILFTPENYGKSENGSKTQTRRIITPQPPEGATIWQTEGIGSTWQVRRCDPWHSIKCPYGTVGDRLYVKEGLEKYQLGIGYGVRYRRDKKPVARDFFWERHCWQWQRDTISPLHMPKWAARLWLEIVDVRVERLHDISENDARAEGCLPVVHEDGSVDCGTRKTTFRALWESNKIHKPGSWDVNPWLWVLTFRKVER